MVVGCQPYALAAFTSRKYSLYSFLLEAESTPGPQCDRKDFMSMKNPLTPAGIEPATFQFVPQHLNYCATAVPKICNVTQPNCFQNVVSFHTLNASRSHRVAPPWWWRLPVQNYITMKKQDTNNQHRNIQRQRYHKYHSLQEKFGTSTGTLSNLQINKNLRAYHVLVPFKM